MKEEKASDFWTRKGLDEPFIAGLKKATLEWMLAFTGPERVSWLLSLENEDLSLKIQASGQDYKYNIMKVDPSPSLNLDFQLKWYEEANQWN